MKGITKLLEISIVLFLAIVLMLVDIPFGFFKVESVRAVARDPDQVLQYTQAAAGDWLANDNGTGTNLTTCFTDTTTTTSCSRISQTNKILRIYFNSGVGSLANGDTITVNIKKLRNSGPLELLAYTGTNTVTDLDRITIASGSVTTGNNVFTLTTAFINRLADLGSGSFALRLVAVSGGNFVDRAETTEIDADLTNIAYTLNQKSYILENDDGANVNSNTADVAVDTSLTSVNKGERINARIQLDNTGSGAATSKTYKVQFENNTDAPGTWTDVGATTAISYSSGLSGTNGDAITSNKAASNGNTWANGTWHEGTGSTGSYSLTNGYYTEFVFAVETSNATLGKTYRLRLVESDDTILNGTYTSYPTIAIIATETKRYSKDTVASLETGTTDLTYYLDPEGYADVGTDENSNRDEIASTTNIPVINFASIHTNNTDKMSVTWNGQSTVAASTNNIVLQVYRFGTTNAWETVTTESSLAANTDGNILGTQTLNITEYYDGSNVAYWRVYQASGTQTLKTDYYTNSFSAISSATWREAEDVVDPTASSALAKSTPVRLRMSVSSTGTGSATNFVYRLEYGSTGSTCAASPPASWTEVPLTASTEHFDMVTSGYFVNDDATTAKFANTESYTFVAGAMVEDPSNASSAVTLAQNQYTEIEYAFQATTNATDGGTYCFRVTNNGVALDSYSKYAQLTLEGGGGSTFTQNDFEWFVTANSVTLTNAWPPGLGANLTENEVFTQLPASNEPLVSGDQIRVQMNITVGTATLAASSQAFKLQYDAAEDCTTASGWTDVGAKASGTIWRLFDEAAIGDSTAQVNDISTSTASAEGYYSEINASGTNPNEVLVGENSEWDWPIENNGATENTTYCFRMVLSDNTVLDTYNSDGYPKLTTAPGMSSLMRHGNSFQNNIEQGFHWTE